ncbi:hypothetical protein JCM5350_004789 [Sporobolomyces pararoseus]
MASNFEVDWLARTMGSMTTLTWPERFDSLRKAILATSFAQNNEERFNSCSSRIDQFIERVENDRVSEPDMDMYSTEGPQSDSREPSNPTKCCRAS